MTGAVITQTERRFEADASAAQQAPEVRATLTNGRARLSAGPFNWEADLSAALGGGNLAPSPTAYLLGALAGCAVAFLHDTLAPQLGITIDDVTAVARCRTDARGLLGMPGAEPDLAGIELSVTIASEATDEELARLQEAWLQRCPIFLALAKPNDVATTFQRGLASTSEAL
jgi:uncharacterized OsmC-like protein